MNPLMRLFGFLLFWIMLGLLLAGTIMYLRGDLQLYFGAAPAPAASSQPVALQPTVAQKSFADAVSIAAPAVVTIHAISTVDAEIPEGIKLLERFLGKNSPHLQQPQTRKEQTSGSGVIMDAEGYILTNHHVIKNAEKIGVVLTDGRFAIADIVGTDPETDLAVLKVALSELPHIAQSDIDNLRIGDIALAIGYPPRIGLTVTQGIISATGRQRISATPYQNYIQTDAAINPGNSGGALVNSDGELIGINTLQSATFQGIGFAIPVDMANNVYSQIKHHGHVIRGWIGLEGQPVTLEIIRKLDLDISYGILITTADENGPGYNAGLKQGDIITHIGDHQLRDITEIMQKVANSAPGDTIVVKGLRMRESFVAEVTLAERPLQSQ